MAELAFLDAIATYLGSRALTPPVPPGRIGALEPFVGSDLPCVVLSLGACERLRVGLGDRGELMTGALAVRQQIDLADAHLPGDPDFRLIDAARQRLILPHGGQVRADGTEGALSGADLSVSIGATVLSVVADAPGVGQVQGDPGTGALIFGAALPDTGTLDVRYFLGAWERRVARIAGTLCVEGCASGAPDAASLLASVVSQLLASEARTSVTLLLGMSLTTLSSVAHHPAPTAVAPVVVGHFRRHATFAFEYQQLIDEPESSGGVIRQVPITTRLETLRTDRVTGALLRDVETVP